MTDSTGTVRHARNPATTLLPLQTFVAACLRRKNSAPGSIDDLSHETIDWLKTVELANRDLVAPPLWSALQEMCWEGRLPPDVRDYLRYIHAENARCNEQIRTQCLRIGRILHSAGVEAVLLKGATWLFEDWTARGDRMMRDIDLLVSAEQSGRARAALVASGYGIAETIAAEAGNIHELPLLCEGEPANVELHVELSTRVWLLPGREMLRGSQPVAAGLRIPEPRFRIAHNIIHAQITNGDFIGGVVSLRDTLDLARLTLAHFDAVDWNSMAADAKQRGYFREMSGAIHKAARFGGAPLPAAFAEDRRGHFHAARCDFQQRLPVADRWLRRFGILRRATAWERDSYVLGLGDDRSFGAWLRVNRRRAVRTARALKRAWRGQ
ncbi:nucleotidyltransferase family protein [Mesorhizobium sp. INR15]|uniref:nucleotidyltransferase family protein n=1 Tax=Mesorhizobium sp. INR15 TaxID=2654248 RepID=UPI00189654D7|nr:nucleotidyltransferase family protein [Mesorhizobium sp. INR15]QPC95458.1 hypothetical protein GA829_33155 [Mesorhizobium sp. INR15]